MTIEFAIHSIVDRWSRQACDARCRRPRLFVTGVPSGVQESGRWHLDPSLRAITSCVPASPFVSDASTLSERQSAQTSAG